MLAGGRHGRALVTGDKMARFKEEMAGRGLGVRPLAKARAQHYTKGKWFTLYLVEPFPLAKDGSADTKGAGS